MKHMIIIGSGIAGLSCAIEAAERGCSVDLVSPFLSERAQSVMAAGGINAATNTWDGDSVESHVQDTLKGGVFLENEKDVIRFCQRAPGNLEWLESMGVLFKREKDGMLAVRAFGGQSHKRTHYAGASTGKQIVTALTQKCLQFEVEGKVRRTLGLNFHSALIRDGKCYGALFIDPLTGQLTAMYGDAVVMATGGQNKLFGKTTGSELCDGYAAGRLFSQGVELRNLEFIQYHPTTIETSHKRMLISEAARGEGGRLYYLDGDKRVYFMEDKYGPKGNLMPRDVVSREIYACPSQVYLDVTFLGKKLIHEKLEEIYDLCMEYIDLDVTKEPIPVSPSIHYFMGGVHVDSKQMTNVQDLYAVGEFASKYHGANRLGGNSLLGAVHSGRLAAEAICEAESSASEARPTQDVTEPAEPEFAGTAEAAQLFAGYIAEVQQRIDTIKASKSRFPSVYMLQNLAEVLNRDLGIVRTAEELNEGLSSVDYYLGVLDQIQYDPQVSLYESARLGKMFLLAKAILMSAAAREESRGSHFREDFPETKDEFRKSTIARYADGEITISFEEL